MAEIKVDQRGNGPRRGFQWWWLLPLLLIPLFFLRGCKKDNDDTVVVPDTTTAAPAAESVPAAAPVTVDSTAQPGNPQDTLVKVDSTGARP